MSGTTAAEAITTTTAGVGAGVEGGAEAGGVPEEAVDIELKHRRISC